MNLFEFNANDKIVANVDDISLVEIIEDGIVGDYCLNLIIDTLAYPVGYDSKEACEKDYNLLIDKMRGEG